MPAETYTHDGLRMIETPTVSMSAGLLESEAGRKLPPWVGARSRGPH